MKLRVQGTLQDEQAELPFHEDGGNTLSSIVRIKPDRTRNVDALNKVSITTQAETSKGGVRRILVRVSMPYMALDPSSVDGNASNLTYSPTRSGRTLSVHAVITLPREAVEDLRGQRVGSAGVASAAGQVALLQNILTGITEVMGTPVTDAGQPDWKNAIMGLQYYEASNLLVIGNEHHMGLLGTSPAMVTSADSVVTRALLGSTPLNTEVTVGRPVDFH